MNAIKSLMAVSVLAAAGAANAATVATWDAQQTATQILYHLPSGGTLNLISATKPHTSPVAVTGASLDVTGATNTLTIDIAGFHFNSLLGTDSFTNTQLTVTGTWDGSTFTTGTPGSYETTGCTNGPVDGTNVTCASVPLNVPDNTVVMSGSFTLAGGGSLTMVQTNATSVATYRYDLTNGQAVSAVPVPAAAWLFGSGLLGLAGTARRRRAA